MNPPEGDVSPLTQRESGKRGRKKKEGFFTKEEKPEKPKKEKKPAAPKKKKEYGCELCGLWEKVQSPKMKYTGKGELRTFILAESAGAEEDKMGIQLVGRAGQFLRTHLRSNGFELDRDFYKSNAVRCRCATSDGTTNRPPTDTEIKCCRSLWQQEVEELKPFHIFLLGESAVKAFFGERGKKIKENLSISRWRKLCIPDPWSRAWVMPMFHPSFVLRNPDAEHVFARDLKWALGNLRKAPPEFPDWRSKVETITDYREVIQFISRLYEEPEIAIDYETNRLRPYAPGSEVVSNGVGARGKGYAFPMTHPESGWSFWEIEEVRACWASFIRNYSGKLLVHNHQMERIWTKRFFGVDAQNWDWDSMVVAHILDERQQYTSLDFQTFIHWGFEYGSEIEPYKQSVDKEDDESFNRMKEAPLLDLLQYNGLDAMFTCKLKQQQAFEIERIPRLKPAVDLFLAGIRRFADMEDLGIRVNDKYYQEKDKELGGQIEILQTRLRESEEARIFEKQTGKSLKWTSNAKDLPVLIYKILGKEAKVFTPKGKPSANKEVIQEIEGEFFENLRELRKLEKMRNTYLSAFLGSIEGRLHPSFNLHTTRSFRSSGSEPNFQNIPKRDPELQGTIRGGVLPTEGHQWAEVDYSSHEVRIIACLSEDPVLISDLRDGVDLHGLFAQELGVKRFDAKNSFVFAEFYGSYYKLIWEALKNLGYEITLEKVKEVEILFWKRYLKVREWQERIVKDYRKTGYLTMPWGFRRRGLLERNKCFNTPVQAAAFHCLLWSINKITEEQRKRNWSTNLTLQIHDSILFDMNPLEKEEVVSVCSDVMTNEIMKENDWLKIPLKVEWSFADQNQSWAALVGD